jgi:hypothetical protein
MPPKEIVQADAAKGGQAKHVPTAEAPNISKVEAGHRVSIQVAFDRRPEVFVCNNPHFIGLGQIHGPVPCHTRLGTHVGSTTMSGEKYSHLSYSPPLLRAYNAIGLGENCPSFQYRSITFVSGICGFPSVEDTIFASVG